MLSAGGSRLTIAGMSGNLSDMKQVKSREFQKAFSKVAEELKQGETVEVTKRGEPLGYFTKAPIRAVIKMPDFETNLAAVPLIGQAGEKIISDVVDARLS